MRKLNPITALYLKVLEFISILLINVGGKIDDFVYTKTPLLNKLRDAINQVAGTALLRLSKPTKHVCLRQTDLLQGGDHATEPPRTLLSFGESTHRFTRRDVFFCFHPQKASKRMVLSEKLTVKIKSSMYAALTSFSDQSSSLGHVAISTTISATIFGCKTFG